MEGLLKTSSILQGYANAVKCIFRCGRSQSWLRLMSDPLGLRSKNDLDNRFSPCSKSFAGKAYPLQRLGF